jgi:hypothetical protein
MDWSVLILIGVFAIGLLVGGYLTGLTIVGLIVGTLLVPRFGRLAIDPIWTALLLTPIFFASGFLLGSWLESSLILYLFVFLAGMVAYWPLLGSIALFLLWWNPAKYKEYRMKQARLKRKEELELEKNGSAND